MAEDVVTRVVVNKSITLESILIILSIIEQQLSYPKLIICNTTPFLMF